MHIPFSKTTLGEEEKLAIGRVIDSGWVVMGDKTREFEEVFSEYVGGKYGVFVDSCTSALFLSLKYFDPVTFEVPSLTFTATAEAVLNTGHDIKFVDVDKDTFCIPAHAGSLPVNLMGNRAKGEALIYDSAHRIEKDDVFGSNSLWCYSFYATKNMTTIQGGMIVTNSKSIADWLKLARDHGISHGTEERYKKGAVNYDVGFVGWREKSDDVHAAIGLEQLKKLPWMTERRNYLVNRYSTLLVVKRTGNHIFPLLVENRPEFVDFMRNKGIQVSVHFLPLHKMTAYQKYPHEDMTNTEYLGERLVSLPLYPQMTDEEQDYIISNVKEFGYLNE